MLCMQFSPIYLKMFPAEPKYRFPARFRKSLALFNLHRAVVAGKSVVVVEGFFDCF